MLAAETVDHAMIGRRVRELREARGVEVSAIIETLEISQPTYSRVEAGARPLKGHELVLLADLLGVRVASIVELPRIKARVRYAARTDGTEAGMEAMKERLCAYLELDSYLTSQGID